MADVTIEVIKNGPYIIKGIVELKMRPEIRIRLKNAWRFVDAAPPRPSRFATAPIQKLDFKPRRKQCRTRPKPSGFESARASVRPTRGLFACPGSAHLLTGMRGSLMRH